MPRISTKTHAGADYAMAALLLVKPGATGARDARVRLLLRGVGATVLGQALVTDWELSARRVLPVPAHLALDATTGATLLASPWLLGLRSRGAGAWLPAMMVGATEAALAALTRRGGGATGGDEASSGAAAGGGGQDRPQAGVGADHEALHEAHVPGAPVDQPDQRAGEPPRSTENLPDPERMAGLEPSVAPAPVEAPGPSVPAPEAVPSSTTELRERTDATVPDPEALGVAGRDPVDQLAAREEAAAAAEAAAIGGPAPATSSDDPAWQPVEEGGGGEAEGFEQAEDLLIRNASHDTGAGDPLRDAIDPEAESDRSGAEYGEADNIPATGAETEAGNPDDDPGAGARRGAE